MTVCELGNSGVMNIAGWMYGSIMDWEYSINGGSSWIGTGQTGTTYAFSGLTTQTMYRVKYEGGFCADAISGSATVSIEAAPEGGSIIGDGAFCVTNATGVLNLTGTTDPVVQWEYSTNGGTSWNAIANSSTTQNFTSLASTTWYRALVDGGTCPDVYSDTAIIQVDQVMDPADLIGSTSHCASSANGTITATGNIGPVNFWQSSIDGGASWTMISNNTTTLNYSNLFTTTLYRAYTEGGQCPDYYSDTAVIIVQPVPPQPTLLGSNSMCVNNVNGNLTLTGPFGTVLGWESSTNNGASWTPISNTTSTQSYTGITTTTIYRVLVEGTLCPDVYSDTALIYIDPLVNTGTMMGGDSICIDNVNGFLTLAGSTGTIDHWESSVNSGATWTTISNTTDTQSYSGITETTWYRVFIDGGFCPSLYSDTGVIFIDTLVIPGNVLGSDSVCEMAIFGSLSLTGSSGTVSHWETSTNSGVSWDVILNVTNNLNYFSVSTTTWYRVYSKALFCTGEYSDTGVIYIDPLTVSGVIDTSQWICPGDSVLLTLENYTATIFQWQLSPDGINWGNVPGATSVTYTPTDIEDNQYYHVISQNGLCPPDISDPILISVYDAPLVDAGLDVSIMLYDSTQLTGMGGIGGFWSPALGLSDSLLQSPVATPSETTMYYYTVIDTNGCRSTDSVLVTITRPDHVDVMNVITSNDDGYNDTWIIDGIQFFPSTFVTVFNIYGKEVYKNEDYKNDWRGTYKDNLLPNGTYYYTVIPGGTEKRIQGTLTIMGNE
jgi:gliding motility-associated-like protein